MGWNSWYTSGTDSIKLFYKNGGSITAGRREFRHYYNLGNHNRFPSGHTIKTSAATFEEMRSKGNHLKVNKLNDT